MVDGATFTRMAMLLPETVAAPHFDRTAFKVRRIYATLAADGRSANLMFKPEEQEFKCMLAPEVFQRIDNGWGRKGATTLWLEKASEEDARAALKMAHAHAVVRARTP